MKSHESTKGVTKFYRLLMLPILKHLSTEYGSSALRLATLLEFWVINKQELAKPLITCAWQKLR